MQRIGPRAGREVCLAQQGSELAARKGPTSAERRMFKPRPDAAPVGHDDDQPTAGRQNAPDFLQCFARILCMFERMDKQHPVDGRVDQRQFLVKHQRGCGRSIGRPVHGALRGRHEGEDTLRIGAEPVEPG